ncbi:MAG: PocR ligand-binding domain-containing protein, partial [Deltaproteobacteria bacterium]|nr:PocR ligand-binding domain-containing protein [Deltaproteobacteria bacterium]
VNGQPITKPHNFSVLCRNYCRSSKLGKQKCHESDSYGGKQSAKLKKRFIYKCLNAGLLDSASPIIVKNYHQHRGLFERIRKNSPDESGTLRKHRESNGSCNLDNQ